MVLPRSHPLGDFGFCLYQWSDEERQRHQEIPVPPRFIHNLPADTPFVPFSIFTRDLECDWQGPSLRAAKFRRLNACLEQKLLFIDLFGTDELEQARPFAVVPSEDIQPTEEQRDVFKRNLALPRGEFPHRTPSIHFLLSTGRNLADYCVGDNGPLVYGGYDWSKIWALLHSFCTSGVVEHPAGHVRAPHLYRHPLRTVYKLMWNMMRTSSDASERDDVHAE